MGLFGSEPPRLYKIPNGYFILQFSKYFVQVIHSELEAIEKYQEALAKWVIWKVVYYDHKIKIIPSD
jgi:hypothetical protein